jgi:hypothetical protein
MLKQPTAEVSSSKRCCPEQCFGNTDSSRYWFGSPDEHGRNLATCVWRSPHDARIGSLGEAHRKAAGATRFLYTEWKIERLRLTIKDDAKEWAISEWTD